MNIKVKINLARMYEFINDALEICDAEKNDYEKILSDKKNQLAITMCLSQIGEMANVIRKIDETIYKKYNFNEPKGMRDRIVHGYGKIDFDIVKETLKNDLPRLKLLIENTVEKEILNDPYKYYDEMS